MRDIYSAIYGEVNVSVEKCVEIKGKIAKLFYFCHLTKLVRPEILDPTTYIHRLTYNFKAARLA